MNLAHKLLKISSFNLEGKCEKDTFFKLIQFNFSCLVIIVFFVIQSFFAILFLDSILLMLVSVLTAFIISINLNLAVKRKNTIGLDTFTTVISGIGLLISVFYCNMGVVGSLLFGLFPFLTISMLGFNKGTYFSIAFGILCFLVFFIPLQINTSYNQPLSYKLYFTISYFAAIILANLFEAIKVKTMQNSEMEVLNEKNANKLNEEFIAKLSHQIRTPLNNIMVISNILSGSELDDKQRDMIDTIQASTNNLVNVLNSMVEISNIDIRENSDFNINFNLQTTINNTLNLFTSQSFNNISFNYKIDENLPKNYFGDPVKIKQVFLNIIENIIKNKSSNKTHIDIKIGKSKESQELIELYFELKSNKPIILPVNENHNQFIVNETTYTSTSSQIYIELLDLLL